MIKIPRTEEVEHVWGNNLNGEYKLIPLESSLMSNNRIAGGESMSEFSPVNGRSSPSSVLHIGGVVPEVHGVEGGLVASHTNSAAKRLTYRTIVACFSHEWINGLDLSPTCSKKKQKKRERNEAGIVSEVWGQTQQVNLAEWIKVYPLMPTYSCLPFTGFWLIE